MIRKPDTSAAFKPPIPTGPEFLALTRDAFRGDGRLDAALLGPSVHQLLLGMARLRNMVSTVRIEGERVDLEGARRAYEAQKGESAAEEQVVRLIREYTRIHDARPSQVPKFSIRSVLDLHRRLFGGLYDEAGPGRLKTQMNGIGDTATGRFVFEATPPARTEAELESLFGWFEQRSTESADLVTAGIFFAEFERIHPFHDGNGRVGRLLNLMAMKRLGFENVALTPLDGRYYHTQSDYYAKLSTTNPGRIYSPWCRYNAQQVGKAYEIALRRANVKPLIDGQGRRSTRAVLEWILSGDASFFAISDYPNPRRLSPEAILYSLKQLVHQGVLEAVGERRGRKYRFSTRFLRDLYGGTFG